MREVVVALAGNPNVGKTALINSLTGAKLKVGNWPGVTVEKKEVFLKYKDTNITFVDLPGIYSLTPFSVEERIARDFLINSKIDAIVNVVDSTNIERNLYLTTQLAQLAEFGIPILLVLNFWDEVRKKGIKINTELIESVLGVKCIPAVAVDGTGVDTILEILVSGNLKTPKPITFSEDLERLVKRVEEDLRSFFKDRCPYPVRWAAVKVVENDEEVTEALGKLGFDASSYRAEAEEIERLKGEDIATIFAEERYSFISGLVREAVKRPYERRMEITDVLDAIFMHRVLGLPIFLLLMYLVFKLTFDGSAPFIDWVDGLINGFIAKWCSYLINLAGLPEWLRSLLIDGVLQGVGLVLSFVPLMLFLYFFLAVLEETGYMARAAFVMDRLMHSVGLHGKSFIPLVIGFRCNVPAILATRTLERERDRKLTALLVPFMSCGARLPIYALFTGVFFKKHQAEVVLLLYLMGVLVSLAVGVILRKTVLKGESPPFIMELPPYRFPTWKMLWNSIWMRTKAFVHKAGTVIALSMVILWLFTNLPFGTSPENSLLGKFSREVAVVFKPAGFGNSWQAVAALIPGTIAKEVVVGALGQLYGVEEESASEKPTEFADDLRQQIKGFFLACRDSFYSMFGSVKVGVFEMEEENTGIATKIAADFSPLSAFSYMVFCLLWIPCIVTLGAYYREFGWSTVGIAILITTVVPWIISTLIYNLGVVFGFH